MAARRPPPGGPRAHRNEGGLRRRHVRHVRRDGRREDGARVPDGRERGGRHGRRHDRRTREPRTAACPAAGVRRGRRRPVRLLHARHDHGGSRAARAQPAAVAQRDRALARQQPVPLHRVRRHRGRDRVGGERPAGPATPERHRRGRRQRGVAEGDRRGHGRGLGRRRRDRAAAARGLRRAPSRRRARQGDRPRPVRGRPCRRRNAPCPDAAQPAPPRRHRAHRHRTRPPGSRRRGDPPRPGRPGEQLRTQGEGPARPGGRSGSPARRSRRPRRGDLGAGRRRCARRDRRGVPRAAGRADARRCARSRRAGDPRCRQPARREPGSGGRRRRRLRRLGRRCRAHLHDPVERARVPRAGSGPRGVGRRHARGADVDPVLALPAGRDRADARPARRTRSRHPGGQRRCLRRQDRDLVPVPGRARHLPDRPAGQDGVQPRRVVRLDHQAPPLPDPLPDRRDARRRPHGARGRHARRHRGVRVVRAGAHGQDVRLGGRAVSLAERRAPRARRLHEQPDGGLHAGSGHDPGRVRGRSRAGPARRRARDRSARASRAEPAAPGRPPPVRPGPRARAGLLRDHRSRPAALARGAGAVRTIERRRGDAAPRRRRGLDLVRHRRWGRRPGARPGPGADGRARAGTRSGGSPRSTVRSLSGPGRSTSGRAARPRWDCSPPRSSAWRPTASRS